jgi:signal transduction histidine kinase
MRGIEMTYLKYEILDKLLLLFCSTTLYLLNTKNKYAIVPVILAVLLSSLLDYFEDDRMMLVVSLCFSVLCIFMPEYIMYHPILLYNVFRTKYQYAFFTIPFLYILHFFSYSSIVLSLTTVFIFAAYLLKYKTDRLLALHNEYNELRDSSTQISMLLEDKNRSLLKNQVNEINLATLNERNRISKEIHDNIGHLLSRSLLQIGALLTITKDELIKENLSDLKNSLSEGMDQIRSSIHQMYDESIDLYGQIEHLTKDFTLCPVSFVYDITNPPTASLKFNLISIVKEALSNIIRHSNATKVTIQLREHPAMYQLVIRDNGTLDSFKKEALSNLLEQQEFGEGMGLRNIYERIKGFQGNVNISFDQGFQLFISIPKKASASKRNA